MILQKPTRQPVTEKVNSNKFLQTKNVEIKFNDQNLSVCPMKYKMQWACR